MSGWPDSTNKLHAHAGSELGHETPPTTMPTTELTPFLKTFFLAIFTTHAVPLFCRSVPES